MTPKQTRQFNASVEAQLRQAYREIRAKYTWGVPAKTAIQWARAQVFPKVVLTWENERASFEHKGFKVTARITPDEHSDLSYLGEYTSKYQKGAIVRFAPDSRSREHRFFIPSNPEYGRIDYKRMEAYTQGHWCMVGVVVKVYRAGIELGSASVWGIESDSEERYFTDTAVELAEEAVEEARKAVKALCQCMETEDEDAT